MDLPLLTPEVLASLHSVRAVVALTGAGVSAESGIPTFRDALTGMWAKFDPLQLATPEAFARDPASVTQWFDERRVRCAASRPNPGHLALTDLQRRLAEHGGALTLVTQNVDRLHQRAGTTGVIELHGSLYVWRCSACGLEQEELGPAFAEYPPRCTAPGCEGLRRPGVVWFHENLPEDALRAAREAVARCDLFLSLGTSSQVYPAAGLIELAWSNGARTLEINPERTPISRSATWSLRAKTGEALPALLAALDL